MALCRTVKAAVILGLAPAILALAAPAAWSQAKPQAVAGVSATTILIGQSAPLSGANKDLGDDIRNGALAYFRKVNEAGGVNGRRIELVTLDDGNVVQRAGENTQRLIEERGVFALFGYASATLSRPALPHVEKHRVPFLAPFTGADPMRVFNRHVYNMRASYADELEKIVDHYSLFGIKRFSIVHYDDVVGNENYTAVDRALKKRNLAAVSVAAFKDRAKPDIETGVKAVLKGNPEVVILTTLYKATSDFIKAARKAGSTAQMVSNSFPGSTPLAKELGKDGAGVAIAQVVPPPSKQSVPVVAEYRAAIEKHLGRKEYSFTSLESFIAAKVTVEGLRRAGPKLTREAFMQALDGMSGYDAGGYTVGFSPTNHNGSAFVELTIIGKDLLFKH
jgi:ABC-type branched-subunit amino acid transport system substrate-binding protein